MYGKNVTHKRYRQGRNEMTKAVKLHLDYHTKSEEQDLENYIMLLTLWLDSEASKYDVQTSCKSEKQKHRLHLVLAGKSERVQKFLAKLRSKKTEYQNMIDDYDVSEPQPYKGKLPDWEYHDLVVAQRAAYLRTAYMGNVKELLQQLVKRK
jgi:acylphosphatase